MQEGLPYGDQMETIVTNVILLSLIIAQSGKKMSYGALRPPHFLNCHFSGPL